MVTIESALQVLKRCGGNLDMESGKVTIPSEVLEKAEIKKAVHVLKEAGPDKVKAVLSSQTHCQDCPYYSTGPDSFGSGIIHWCGPWSESDGERWVNITELTACPLGRWGAASRAVH